MMFSSEMLNMLQMLALYVNATKDTSILKRALPLAEVASSLL